MITCEWLDEYVPKPSLEDLFNGAFEDQSKRFGYNATFWYPSQGGIQALCDAFASRIHKIHLNEKVALIDQEKKTVVLESDKKLRYEKLVSTMPLNVLVSKLSVNLPGEITQAAQKLKHNSILIVNLGVQGEQLTDKHWIYLPEKKYSAYRVGVYSNFSKNLAPKGTTSYYVEISYQKEWQLDKQSTIEKAIGEMVEIGLIKKVEDILVKEVMDVECAYVIYDKDYSENRKLVLDYLIKKDIFSIGRYGSWEYTGMEEAMKQGKDTVLY
jgi:protoporphyrinogen oxidase